MSFDRSLGKLLVATVLLNALILAAYVTSTPESSPAATWRTAIYRARYRIAPLDPVTDARTLAGLHLRAGTVSTPECVACHGTMLDSKVAFHRIHLDNELLPGLRCGDCHRRVDLSPRGNALVVEWVDVSICKKCHSPFPGSNRPGATMRPMDFETDCTMCHTGNHALRHESPFLSQVIAPNECMGCHGGRVLPWDPLHERPDWLRNHGAAALRSGDDKCFRCHDFGLKFCDTCHELKPPSHTPADRWKNEHRAAARADTRVCHTCHRLDSCRRCHLSHEQGWRDRHAEVVRRRTSSSCRKCHSTSFCGYCHTQHSTAVDDATSAP